MANVLSTGAWLSAPTKNSRPFERLLRAYVDYNQRRAVQAVSAYIAAHGLKQLSDDAARQIRYQLAKADQ